MKLSVLIPYRPDGGPRDAIWAWLRRRYELLLPDAEIVVSDDLHQQETFNRGQARNLAAEKASGDIYLVGDADTGFNPAEVITAVTRCSRSGWWMVPHTYHQLSQTFTDTVLAAAETRLVHPGMDLPDWTGVETSVAPILVVPADAFHAVGGYDERYPGWGSDDRSFAIAMSTLYQPYVRWRGAVFHLWHPRTETFDTGARLTLDYISANGDREELLKLREGHLVR